MARRPEVVELVSQLGRRDDLRPIDASGAWLWLRGKLRRIPEAIAENTYVKFGGRGSFGWMSNDFFPDGYIGDPTPATAALGERLFEGAVQAFSEALAEIAAFEFRRSS